MKRMVIAGLVLLPACLVVTQNRAERFGRPTNAGVSEVPVRGSPVEIRLRDGRSLKGELLAVEGTEIDVSVRYAVETVDWSEVRSLDVLEVVHRERQRKPYKLRITALKYLPAYARYPQGRIDHEDIELPPDREEADSKP